MLWRNQRQSDNVEDLRNGVSGGQVALGGGGCGCGTLLLIILALVFGVDPRALLNQTQTQTQTQNAPVSQTQNPNNAQNDEMKQFVSSVLGSTEDYWGGVFRQSGRQYRQPKLVLFNDVVRSACGRATSASGPFYCPGDEKVYIDLSFYRELKNQFRAPGDFAQAYVIAHEIGHHIQKLTGTSDKVDALQARAGEAQSNELSVRLELQADCYAGMWANYAQKKGILEQGDIQEALTAATAIGDDKIQQQAQGYTRPDSFTHGTSAQRTRWFTQGFKTGDIRQCNTFSGTP